MVHLTKNSVVLVSPFLIAIVNYIVAILAGRIIGKWAFIPIILIEWCMFAFFIWRYGGADSIKDWLKKPTGSFGWALLALAMGIITMPIFLMHYNLLGSWEILIPWILLAIINPWIEEFYWRGLLLDYAANRNHWLAIIFTSFVFAANHAVFGVNSELLRGGEILASTFVMGLIWAVVYKKTNSLRWTIFAHFLVDFFSMSSASFLDLYSR